MMNENDIKKELDNYEIKTTSKMILDRLPKKKHYKFNPFITLTLSISTLGMAAAVLALVLTLNMKNNLSSNITNYTNTVSLSSKSLESQVALEVLYAGNMNETTVNSLVSEITQTEFEEAVDNIDSIYPLVSDLYNHLDNLSIDYEKGKYTILNTVYNYKYQIVDYILYTNDDMFESADDDELEIEGDIALDLNGSIYNGTIELEIEEDESEVKLEYYMGTRKVTIKKEIEAEDDENEISYSYKIKDTNIDYKKKISIETENNMNTFKYVFEDNINNITEELIIEEYSNYYLIDYNYESDSKEINIEDIKLTVEENKTYTYLEYTKTL